MALELMNVVEEVVEQLLDQIIKEEGACTCAKCRMDIKALALNRLPPKYVVTERGSAFENFRMSLMQNKVDIYQAVLFATQRVKASPQHEGYTGYQ